MTSHFLASRRFMPLFITQFLGAFNDNLFKNAFVILVTYQLATHDSTASALLVNMAFALITLPSLLFSSLAGSFADKFDRTRIVHIVKLSEIALAFLGGLGLFLNNVPLMLITLFGLGTHSTFFGPIKYALLPQHLKHDELIAGNGYIEAGTFLAILSGTIIGGLLILTAAGPLWTSLIMMSLACCGYIASRKIPASPAPVPDLSIDLNLWRSTRDMMTHSQKRREEFLPMLGISWFWFMGATYLAQLSPLAKDYLYANENVVTLFLVAFSVGIAFGSILCGRLIKGMVRATPIPFATLGMTVFALDIYFVLQSLQPVSDGTLLSAGAFLQETWGQRLLIDFFALALCGGFYIVPLYALLQTKAAPGHGARTIAANNIYNALFMVGAAFFAIILIKLGTDIPTLFLIVGLLNTAVFIYILRLLPFSLVSALFKFLYRVEIRGLENWEKAGKRVLIIANHTAYLDAAICTTFLPEQVIFAVNSFTAKLWWVKPFLKMVTTYPMDPTNPMATKTLIDELKRDKKIMIFPEGRLTMTGGLMKIYEGAGLIADKSGATILPIRIDGPQYSPFSKLKGKVRIRLFPKIILTILPPRPFTLAEDSSGRQRRVEAGTTLYDQMSEMMFESESLAATLLQNLWAARRTHGGKHIIAEDTKRLPVTYDTLLSHIFVLMGAIKKRIGKEEKNIGIFLPNMVATASTFFAVQALARIPVMLNFTAGQTAIQRACETAELRTLITSREFLELSKQMDLVPLWQSMKLHIIYLEDIAEHLHPLEKAIGLITSKVQALAFWQCRHVQPDEAAVILFTSGSEGTPKGVVLSHKNILANRYQLASRIDFGPQDIVFNCLPMFHSFGLTAGTLLPLLSGMKVFFYPTPLHYRIIPELIYDTSATILFGTDTFLSAYARAADNYDFYSLRYIFAGAEKCKEETKRLWLDKFGLRILEGYGVTEAAPVLAVNTPMYNKANSVGRLMPGLQTRLETIPGIDHGQKLVVKGPNIMLGYIKHDAPGLLQPLTDGWYDTGDLVTMDDNGFVSITGRLKRFAKIAGEMISLTAVETAIYTVWPESHHAVISVPDPRKGEMIILLTTHANADLAALPAHFQRVGLTELSLPRRLWITHQIPILGTGKTDYVKATSLFLEQDV
jgi:acyl-[acyl-carrier-protein]-phospholipid O-acyltransferase / long-chain-fatty-acid--[acyl-carrier-protein] ligase